MRRIAPGQSCGRLVDSFVTEAQDHFAVSQSLHQTPRFDPRHRGHISAVHAEELVPSKQLTTLFSAASWKKINVLENSVLTTQPENSLIFCTKISRLLIVHKHIRYAIDFTIFL